MKKKILKITLVTGVLVIVGLSLAYAGDRRYGNYGRRQPIYEEHTTDRWVESTRAGGRGNDGTIHFKTKRTVRRKYDNRDRAYGRRPQRCVDEKGRRVNCR